MYKELTTDEHWVNC